MAGVLVAKEFCEEKLKNKVKVTAIDNASLDGSTDMIEKKYPWVNLIRSKTNLGFAKGNNLGMSGVKTPYILLLNSDVFLGKDTLIKALNYFYKNKSCDILSVRFRYPDGRFQPSGGYSPTPLKTFAWMMGIDSVPYIRKILKPIHIWDESFYKNERILEWASGAFFLLKRDVYEKTGGFDENMFLYMEDIEWCKRIKDKGFRICFTPEIAVVHLAGASSKNNIKNQLMSQMRGLLFFHKKHYPDKLKFTRLAIRIGLLLRYILFKIIGKTEVSGAYLNAYHNLHI
ncbi:MAG: Glycosyltransferase [Candidatus Woesebacteria bacterium GW2011_GWA1_39_21b]|uniref:Glycosyltransferase n=1 Tax=Candidatus Woesebacteria bacterium GW2011_GWA1_39_21b TaxID=1618551 RepID=A0A0G0RCJ7_9BACT|nr:MAG: Glycosyltransferase [Candidatus Woesebacteria bacterium GW2011_GWA1_39_21b]